MLLSVLLPSLTLFSQIGPGIPDESRSPMSIRMNAASKCSVSISGSAWVGRLTIKGGTMEVRDLSGAGIAAVSGVLRFQFSSGRYQDQNWRHDTVGFPAANIKIAPEEMQFTPGLSSPTKIESIVTGVYFANGEVCGETGQSVKDRFTRTMNDVRKDAEEVSKIAAALPAKLFYEAVRDGVLTVGPYSRSSVAATNSLLHTKLIGPDGKLIGEYKEWIKHWQDSLKPAKPTRPTR